MAQAISNKVLVQYQKYSWMICDYTITGSTLRFSLSYYFEGGDAQLDNAWLKVGNTTVWSWNGRIHNYNEADRYRGNYTITLATNRTATISGSQTVKFGITKYQNVAVQGEFTATGGSAPSGLSVTNISSTWNTVTATYSVGSWGGMSASYSAARLFGASGDARLENQFNGQSSYTTTITNNSVKLDGGITIKGCGNYRLDLYASNSVGSANTSDATVYTPPSPSHVLYTDPGGEGTKNYAMVFTGDVDNNSTSYDAGSLTRYVRYKIGNGSWVVVENNTNKALNALSSFTVSVPAGESATIEGYMTYHGKQSSVTTVTVTNSNAPVALYGSVDGTAHRIVKLYGSVNGHAKEIRNLYGSVNGNSRKIFTRTEVIYGKVVYYTDDTYTTTATAYLQASDWTGLCALNGEDDNYTVNGIQFPAKRLKEFEYGKYCPDYTPFSFLAYATHLDTVSDIPSWVTDIGANYMQHCEIYNKPVLIPASVTNISINFMDSCMSLNSNVTMLGTNTVVAAGFLNKMRDMTAVVTINSPADNFTNNFLWPSLSSIDGNSPAYTTGIIVRCPTHADTEAFMQKFPNENGGLIACHRKLIAGN